MNAAPKKIKVLLIDGVFFAAAGGSDASCRSGLSAQPGRTQPCQHETRRHPSESDRLMRTLTLWRVHLEDTSAPPPSRRHPPALPLLVASCERVFSITRLSISTTSHAHRARCASGLTDSDYGLLDITGFKKFPKCDRSAAGPLTAGEDVGGLTSPSYGFGMLGLWNFTWIDLDQRCSNTNLRGPQTIFLQYVKCLSVKVGQDTCSNTLVFILFQTIPKVPLKLRLQATLMGLSLPWPAESVRRIF